MTAKKLCSVYAQIVNDENLSSKSASSSSSSTSSDDAKERGGVLSIMQISDLIYVVEFSCGAEKWCIDLDDVTLIADSSDVSMLLETGTIMLLHIPNSVEFKACWETSQLCQDVCINTLRMKAIGRDFYYSGVYQNISSDALAKEIINDLLFELKAMTGSSSDLFEIDSADTTSDLFNGSDSSSDIYKVYNAGTRRKHTKSSNQSGAKNEIDNSSFLAMIRFALSRITSHYFMLPNSLLLCSTLFL